MVPSHLIKKYITRVPFDVAATPDTTAIGGRDTCHTDECQVEIRCDKVLKTFPAALFILLCSNDILAMTHQFEMGVDADPVSLKFV